MLETKKLEFENPHFLQSLFANDLGHLKKLEVALELRVTTRDAWVRLEGTPDAVRRGVNWNPPIAKVARSIGIRSTTRSKAS